MKFICSKEAISEAVTNVSRAVSPKSTIPALEGIKVRVADSFLAANEFHLFTSVNEKCDL